MNLKMAIWEEAAFNPFSHYALWGTPRGVQGDSESDNVSNVLEKLLLLSFRSWRGDMDKMKIASVCDGVIP